MRDRSHSPNNSFTRIFPDLPPFVPPTDAARDQAKKLGEKGGLIDAMDDLSDPVLSITDPTRNVDTAFPIAFTGDHERTEPSQLLNFNRVNHE